MNHASNGRWATWPALLVTATFLGAGATDAQFARTASGKPDLSGNYDIGTLTPMQRSVELGERLELTPEEAREIAERTAARRANRAAASDPNREAPTAGGNVGGYNDFFMDYGSAATVVDGKYRTSLLIDPPNGRFPPYTERGRARREGKYPFSKKNTGDAWWIDREVGPYDGPESLSIADRCVFSLEATIPVLPKAYNNLKTVVQTDTHVMILIEWMHEARVIHLGGTHPPPSVRRRAGYSVGHWEGDTLVVETKNFLEEDWITTTLFAEPSPPADQRVIERLTPTEDGLLYRFTVESGDYTAPYTGEYTWPRTPDKLYEYACHEGNYSVGNILRGARLLEREARE